MTNLIAELRSNPLLMGLAVAVVKSSGIFLFVWGTTLLLQHRSAAVRHLSWTMALVCSLALLLLPAVTPAWKILPKMASASVVPTSAVAPEISADFPASFKTSITAAAPQTAK